MAEETLVDQIINLLEDRQRRGMLHARLGAENIDFLFQVNEPAKASKPPARTAHDAAASCGGPPPREPAPARRTSDVAESRSPYRAASAPTLKDWPEPPRLDVDGVALDDLCSTVADCRRCRLYEGRTQTVFGVGNPAADLMFIGEGPGDDEDRQGIPFVGKAGQLLTRIIEAMQLQRDDVYIANIVKCRPPGNRNPEADEAAACLPYLKRQVAIIEPRIIVLLGAVPLRFMLNRSGIRRLHGQWLSYDGIDCMPTYHPSYLLRVPAAKRDVWDDMKKVMERLGINPGNG